MEPTPDELAGIVDGFGALTRQELRAALDDLTARSGDATEPAVITSAIDEAMAGYYLVALEPETVLDRSADNLEEPLLLPGPAALPKLPEGGEDLPYLVDVDPRSVNRAAAAEATAAQLRADASSAIVDDSVDRAAELLDVCYEIEAWGPVALDATKTELTQLIDG